MEGENPYECRVPEGMLNLLTKFSGTRSGERIEVWGAQVLLKHVYHIKITRQEGQEKKGNLGYVI